MPDNQKAKAVAHQLDAEISHEHTSFVWKHKTRAPRGKKGKVKKKKSEDEDDPKWTDYTPHETTTVPYITINGKRRK